MAFRIEFAAACERDFSLIFDHLLGSYLGFGESGETAFAHAQHRIDEIRRGADRLAAAPFRGTLHSDILPGLRHVTIDHAVYWFEVDEAARTVRVLAVFFGGEDHVRHMLVRLLRPAKED